MEETVTRRLTDEARVAPVKSVFRLGWEFFIENKPLSLMAIGLYLLLELLTMIPLLGVLVMLLLSVYAQSVQIYSGKLFARAESIEAFVESVRRTRIQEFALRYVSPAFGAWLGWMLVGMLFMALFMTLFFAFGGSMEGFSEQMSDAQLLQFALSLGGAVVPVVLVALLLSYVYPVVQGRVIMSETFGEAFAAVFSILTPAVWRGTMHAEYFRFILVLGLLLIGLVLAASIAVGILAMVPLIGPIVVMVGGIFAMYLITITLSFANVLAREMALLDRA